MNNDDDNDDDDGDDDGNDNDEDNPVRQRFVQTQSDELSWWWC